MKKRVMTITTVFILIIVFTISIGIKLQTNKKINKYQVTNEIVKTGNIIYKDNTIIINYNDLNKYINNLGKHIKLFKSVDTIYNKMIDDLINNSYEISMYDKEDKRILEASLEKENAQKLLKSLIDIKDDTTIKVIFEKNETIKEFDIEKLYYDINRETIIRNNIVKIAQEQIGNTGEKYWNWYGYNHRIEWCAVFVSWLANEVNVLNKKIPKFAWVKVGVDYFNEKEELKNPKNYIPKPGDIIFFDWNNNLVIDHVGIVEKVKNKTVYTIEGNVGLKDVQRRNYSLNSNYIYAYGVPNY